VSEERKKDWIAYAILAAIPTLLFADVLFGTNVFHTRDTVAYHYPMREILRSIVRGGEFPYWNPFIAAGQPLAANPAHEIFYPLSWLIMLPSFRFGFHLHALVHIYIAMFGMYALLRSMTAGRTAAIIGAISFGLGGILISSLHLMPFLFSSAWLPWICLFARRALHDGKRRDFALAAIFLALQLLIAEPMTTLQTGILLGLYALFHGGSTIARKLTLVAILCVVGTLLAAVQIIPMLDHFGDSVRARGIPWDVVSKWSMPPIRVAELVNPMLIGEPDSVDLSQYWGVAVYAGLWKPFFYGIYAGVLMVAGAIAGIATRRKGTALFLTCIAVAFIGAIGMHTPLLRLLYDAGLASSIRFLEKFAILGVFAIIVFASLAIDDVLRGDARARRALVIAAIAITAFTFGMALIGFTPLWEPLFRWMWHTPRGLNVAPMLPVSQGTWTTAGLRALGLTVVLLAATRTRPALWRALLVLFVLTDVGSLVPRLAPRTDASFYDEPASLRALPRNKATYRIYHLGDGTNVARNTMDLFRPRVDRHWIFRNSLTPYSPAAWGFRLALDTDFDLTTLLPTDDFARAIYEVSLTSPARWLRPAVTMSNIQYAIVYRDGKTAYAEAKGIARDVRPVDIRFVGHNPRYFFASQLITIRDRRDFVERLRGGYQPGTAYIFEPAFTPAPARFLALRETTQSATFDVEAAGRAFLYMSVTPHKYWRITIDGNEAPAMVANLGYQGVIVPPGRHIIEMRYRNPLISVGAAISIASLLGLLLFVRRSAS